MDFKVQIEKLDGAQSWRRWKRQMELMLKHHGVLDIVKGHRIEPLMADLAMGTEAEEKAKFENIHLEKVRAYDKEDSLAQVLIESMLSKGFSQSTADPCLFLRNMNGTKMLVLIYVDDGLIAGSNEKEVSELIAQLEKEFKLKVTDPECYLGLEIHRRDNCISLSQTSYIRSILERYRMSDSNPVGTPLIPKLGEFEEDEKPFREAVGSLMYLTNTRPDICCAVNLVAQKVNSPTTQAWSDVKRILRYLKGTIDYALIYTKGEKMLHCYCDNF